VLFDTFKFGLTKRQPRILMNLCDNVVVQTFFYLPAEATASAPAPELEVEVWAEVEPDERLLHVLPP